MRRGSARARLLQAAEKVIARDGAAHLTLDAVAAAAKVSKGGLLYHFASKDELISAMLDHHMDARAEAMKALQPKSPGPLSTQLQVRVSEINSKDVGISRAFFAAAAINPCLLERARRDVKQQFDQLRKADPKGVTNRALLMLALEGLHMLDVFDCQLLTRTERKRVIQEILLRARELDTKG